MRMNKLLNAMKEENNRTLTENLGYTYKSTMNALMDLFAQGGAYRKRTDADCIHLFKKAFDENPVYALKCLFYLRDVRGIGQGERRFFRVIINWLAKNHTDAVRRNMAYIPFFGRWDDMYCLVGTPLEADMFQFMRIQFNLDLECLTPSLLAKWLKSQNASSYETRRLGIATAKAFGLTPREYRVKLSTLRERIRVVECLMSANRWDEIEFDKLPSAAGLKYRNAFARRDIIKAKYEAFAKDTTTKVNAGTLYPYEVAEKAMRVMNVCGYGDWTHRQVDLDDTERLMVNKYWDNLKDTLDGAVLNGIVMADTSGSMYGTPMNVAVSLAMYCAERANGPFKNHFMTFSAKPTLIEFTGVDFCDKVSRMATNMNWGMNTNIEAALDLLLDTGLKNHVPQSEMPKTLIIVSDMQFDYCVSTNANGRYGEKLTVFEALKQKWETCDYEFPHIVFWNVDARTDANIPMKADEYVNYLSGFSPSLFQQLLENKSAVDLMIDTLNNERYACIQ